MSASEQMYWSRLNQAVSSFCVEQLLDSRKGDDKMICSLVGEELEWCGAHTYLFMATRYMTATSRISELEQRSAAAESSFSKELANSSSTRRAYKDLQLQAEDGEWRFQEELAHARNEAALEKAGSAELRAQVGELQAKLVEVEMYVGSDRGAVALGLEEQLAAAKLRIVELEAEKDTAGFLAQQQGKVQRVDLHSGGSNKENRPVNWASTFEE